MKGTIKERLAIMEEAANVIDYLERKHKDNEIWYQGETEEINDHCTNIGNTDNAEEIAKEKRAIEYCEQRREEYSNRMETIKKLIKIIEDAI